MVTQIRLISVTANQDIDNNDSDFPTIENNGEIEIIVELTNDNNNAFLEPKSAIISKTINDFDIFKNEIIAFSNSDEDEVRKAWEVLRDAINSKFPEKTNEVAKKMRRLQDVGADLKILK